MTKEFNDDNRGVLFYNETRTSDNQPTHRGKVKVGGVDYYISAWPKVAKSGAKYISVSFTEIVPDDKKASNETTVRSKPSTKTGPASGDEHFDIPF